MVLQKGGRRKSAIIITLLSLAACGGSSTQFEGTPLSSLSGASNTSAAASISDPKLESYITFDVLGGIFRKSMEIESDADSITVGKTSISLPQPDSQPQTTQPATKLFNIDVSYSFLGKGGVGKLLVSATGQGEDRYLSGDLSRSVREFKPLKLHFIFFNYLFANKCLGNIHVDGEIICEILGNYDNVAQKLVGDAHCTNGPLDNPQTLLYITESKDFEVALDALLKINGNPYSYGSYQNSGKIIIDGVEKNIETLFTEGQSCS